MQLFLSMATLECFLLAQAIIKTHAARAQGDAAESGIVTESLKGWTAKLDRPVQWQREIEGGPFPWPGFNPYPTTVGFDEPLAHDESQSRPPGRSRAASSQPFERNEPLVH